MDRDDLRRRADASVVDAFDLLVRHQADERRGTARFGRVFAMASGAVDAFFNPVLAFEPGTAAADVRAGVGWVRGRGLPASVQVRDDASEAVLEAVADLGMVADSWRSTPVMVLDPIPEMQIPMLPGLVLHAGGAELLDAWHGVGPSPQWMRALFGPALMADPNVRMAVALVDGDPVAQALVIRSGPSLGVYSVATRGAMRRRGFGRAVTIAAIDAGARAWNARMAFLQSSELGLSVYRSIGFDEIGSYTEFEDPER